jgi:hypothetical protein
MTPTQRALAECKKRGWQAQVVEKWIPHTRRRLDLFGVIDIVALIPGQELTGGLCCVYKRPYDAKSGEFTCETCGVTNNWFPGRIFGIQVTSGTNHSARIAKAKAEPRLTQWIESGGWFSVWSYAKRGPRGRAKRWVLREEAVTL